MDRAIAYAGERHPDMKGNVKRDLVEAFIDGGIAATNIQWHKLSNASSADIEDSLPVILYNEDTLASLVVGNMAQVDEMYGDDILPFTHYLPIELPV